MKLVKVDDTLGTGQSQIKRNKRVCRNKVVFDSISYVEIWLSICSFHVIDPVHMAIANRPPKFHSKQQQQKPTHFLHKSRQYASYSHYAIPLKIKCLWKSLEIVPINKLYVESLCCSPTTVFFPPSLLLSCESIV